MAGSVRVLVVDEQVDMAGAIASDLEHLTGFDIIGVAGSVRHAGELAERSPDVALVDARVAGGGAAVAREILAASAGTRILGHSSASDLESVIELLRAGASGYIVKGAPVAELAGALRATARGESPIDSSVAGDLVGELMQQLDRASRVERERAGKRARVADALGPGSLQIAYQPIVDLDAGDVVGHEALARFTCEPRRTPDAWFAEAHDVGMGIELELAAVALALECASELPGGAYLAVNVSPEAAALPELVEVIDAAPVRGDVVLEVTEHARVEDYRRFRRDLRSLRKRGVRLAVDDAGAGFASLRHILELKAELIKLDASLTQDLHKDRGRRSLAAALIGFGRDIGVTIVAEGIETPSQCDELRALGVRYGQGFHLGRPRPAVQGHITAR
jgi:EAL domain-containing protein (putative c-di-GMP-specific phosphodiesterase class I)/AmiR/NasT family two-component response regulator